MIIRHLMLALGSLRPFFSKDANGEQSAPPPTRAALWWFGAIGLRSGSL
jgi:hypothetical protein